MERVRVATPDDAAVLGRMLADFNAEFDAEGQDAAAFARRFKVLLARDDVLALLAGPREAPIGFALATFRPTPYADGPLAQLEDGFGCTDPDSGSTMLCYLGPVGGG